MTVGACAPSTSFYTLHTSSVFGFQFWSWSCEVGSEAGAAVAPITRRDAQPQLALGIGISLSAEQWQLTPPSSSLSLSLCLNTVPAPHLPPCSMWPPFVEQLVPLVSGWFCACGCFIFSYIFLLFVVVVSYYFLLLLYCLFLPLVCSFRVHFIFLLAAPDVRQLLLNIV